MRLPPACFPPKFPRRPTIPRRKNTPFQPHVFNRVLLADPRVARVIGCGKKIPCPNAIVPCYLASKAGVFRQTGPVLRIFSTRTQSGRYLGFFREGAGSKKGNPGSIRAYFTCEGSGGPGPGTGGFSPNRPFPPLCFSGPAPGPDCFRYMHKRHSSVQKGHFFAPRGAGSRRRGQAPLSSVQRADRGVILQSLLTRAPSLISLRRYLAKRTTPRTCRSLCRVSAAGDEL